MKILFLLLFTLVSITSIWLFLYSLHYLFMSVIYLKNKKSEEIETTILSYNELPKITIQLPIYNEMFVAERVIKQCAKLKYPKNKLEIQVLDDSTDETLIISKNTVNELIDQGFNIKWIHRTNREGYKGGALKEALSKCEGDFVAIFDADFIPNEDFLLKVIPYFKKDEKLALVQCRWSFLNPDYSLLTQIQKIGLDAHFLIEQYSRYISGCYFSFNGSAGIWRKKAIYDAGDWNGDTLTEDLDLSYRAQFRGWKFIFLPNVTVNSEIPVLMSSYKSQQFRWAKGFIQCIKKLFKPITKSPLPFIKKAEAIAHLTTHISYPIMLFHLIMSLPMIFMYKNFGKYIDSPFIVLFFTITMVLGISAPLIYLFLAQIIQGKSIIKTIIKLPLIFFINSGLSIHLSKAVWEGFTGKKSIFVRTPKYNIANNTKKLNIDSKYKIKITSSTILELMIAIYALITMILSFKNKIYFTTIFSFFFFIGLCMVSLTDIYQNFKLNLETSRNRLKKIYHIQWLHPSLSNTNINTKVLKKIKIN